MYIFVSVSIDGNRIIVMIPSLQLHLLSSVVGFLPFVSVNTNLAYHCWLVLTEFGGMLIYFHVFMWLKNRKDLNIKFSHYKNAMKFFRKKQITFNVLFQVSYIQFLKELYCYIYTRIAIFLWFLQWYIDQDPFHPNCQKLTNTFQVKHSFTAKNILENSLVTRMWIMISPL